MGWRPCRQPRRRPAGFPGRSCQPSNKVMQFEDHLDLSLRLSSLDFCAEFLPVFSIPIIQPTATTNNDIEIQTRVVVAYMIALRADLLVHPEHRSLLKLGGALAERRRYSCAARQINKSRVFFAASFAFAVGHPRRIAL